MFQKIRVSERNTSKRRGAGITIFPRVYFVSQYPKNIIEEHFRAVYRKVSGSENVYEKGSWKKYQSFPSHCFCLTVPKLFVAEPFIASLISCIGKIYA